MKEFLDKVIELTRIGLKENDELMPTFFVGKGEEVIIVSPNSWQAKAKAQVAEKVREIASETEADFVLFVSESYTILDPEGVQDFIQNNSKYPSIKHHPKAVEVVHFSLETEAQVKVGFARIFEDRNMDDVSWKIVKKEHIGGTLTNFIKSKSQVIH